MKLFFKKNGEGKPLIILHGLFGMSDNWNSISKSFSEFGYCCKMETNSKVFILHLKAPKKQDFGLAPVFFAKI